MCKVRGPGLTSATVNQLTHIIVELDDFSGRPQLNVAAQLELPVTVSSSQICKINLPVDPISFTQCKVSYRTDKCGKHKLHIQNNGTKINGSPFTVSVYRDPRQLGCPVRTVTGMEQPYGIAFNSHREMIVSEYCCHRLSIFDIRGQKIRTVKLIYSGDSPQQMKYPATPAGYFICCGLSPL